MTYTVWIQIMGYLVALKKDIGFGKRLRFYPKWQETGVFIHIHNFTAKYIRKMLPAGGLTNGKWVRGEETIHKIKEDGAVVHVSVIHGPCLSHIKMFKRQKPGKKRPYYSLFGIRDEIFTFLKQLVDNK